MEVTGQEARFRAMFAEEAEGRLATLSELLLELERNGDDRELLSSVFREAHTLKGAAAVVGLADVQRVAHAMEEVLEGLRRGDGVAAPALVDALLAAVDGMREMVPAVLAGDDRGDHADRLVAALHTPPPDPDEAPPTPAPAPPSKPPPSPTPGPAARPTTPAPPRRRETIRLPVERLDELVRLVGEASAAARRVGRLVTDQLGVDPAGVPELHELTRLLDGLQERTLRARMVPFGTIAEPLRRAARDLARSLGKAVELELRGQETELDRGVLEQVADPLLHLVRNAIDHGIEPAEERLGAGKPPRGTVRVQAMPLGSEVVVTVADDGRGIDLERVRQRAREGDDGLDGVGDDEAIYAIFRSGLSTAAGVSEVSGRGWAWTWSGPAWPRSGAGSRSTPSPGSGPSSASASPSPWPSCPACWWRWPGGATPSPCTRWSAPRPPAGPRTTSRARPSSGPGTRSCPSPTWPSPSATAPAGAPGGPATARPWSWPA